MFANHFILKLILAPLIIAAATLVSRRWGERVGGLLVGLPLTSTPVYLLAMAAALGVNGLSLARLVWKNHALGATTSA